MMDAGEWISLDLALDYAWMRAEEKRENYQPSDRQYFWLRRIMWNLRAHAMRSAS